MDMKSYDLKRFADFLLVPYRPVSGNLAKDLKNLITRDNQDACAALGKSGASQMPAKVVLPNTAMRGHEHLQVIGDTDGLTLKKVDTNSSKLFLNIHGAVRRSPTQEVDRKVLSALSALIVGALTTATWEEFEAALTACQGGQHPISRQVVAKAFNWTAARATQVWNNGDEMIPICRTVGGQL